jgi:hypothetical protein
LVKRLRRPILATTVYETYEIELQDGTKVTLKPLSIKKLREFMTHIAKLDGSLSEDQAVDVLIDAATVGLRASAPDLVQDRDKLEDALDMPTITKIIEVCGGIKLDDPNLLTAALLAGQTSI